MRPPFLFHVVVPRPLLQPNPIDYCEHYDIEEIKRSAPWVPVVVVGFNLLCDLVLQLSPHLLLGFLLQFSVFRPLRFLGSFLPRCLSPVHTLLHDLPLPHQPLPPKDGSFAVQHVLQPHHAFLQRNRNLFHEQPHSLPPREGSAAVRSERSHSRPDSTSVSLSFPKSLSHMERRPM